MALINLIPLDLFHRNQDTKRNFTIKVSTHKYNKKTDIWSMLLQLSSLRQLIRNNMFIFILSAESIFKCKKKMSHTLTLQRFLSNHFENSILENKLNIVHCLVSHFSQYFVIKKHCLEKLTKPYDCNSRSNWSSVFSMKTMVNWLSQYKLSLIVRKKCFSQMRKVWERWMIVR